MDIDDEIQHQDMYVVMSEALNNYVNGGITSFALDGDGAYSQIVTLKRLNELARNPQSDLDKTLEINSIIRSYVNIDDIIGKVVESIRVNINTNYRLSYPAETKTEKDERLLADSKAVIERLNRQVNIRHNLRENIPRTYHEGTVILYLRRKNDRYMIDTYPLGIAVISPLSINGTPVVMIDVDKLKENIRDASSEYVVRKDRKKVNLLYDSLDDEIEGNYPDEVFQAYKHKQKYARLDHRYTGVIRINSMGCYYGLSPIFRALPLAVVLNTFTDTDDSIARKKAKSVLTQLMSKELLGTKGDKLELTVASYSHSQIQKAVNTGRNKIYTAPPGVDEVKYVESGTELIDINTLNYYQNKELSTLGIGFLSSSSGSHSVSSANISLEQLMRTINSIAESFEEVYEKWYRHVLMDNGIEERFVPRIKIIDSEIPEMKIKRELATTLYTIFNLSRKTTLDILGIDIEDEKDRRQKENEEKYEDVFYPHQIAYTASGNGEPSSGETGRPQNDPADPDTDPDKQEYDKGRSK